MHGTAQSCRPAIGQTRQHLAVPTVLRLQSGPSGLSLDLVQQEPAGKVTADHVNGTLQSPCLQQRRIHVGDAPACIKQGNGRCRAIQRPVEGQFVRVESARTGLAACGTAVRIRQLHPPGIESAGPMLTTKDGRNRKSRHDPSARRHRSPCSISDDIRIEGSVQDEPDLGWANVHACLMRA